MAARSLVRRVNFRRTPFATICNREEPLASAYHDGRRHYTSTSTSTTTTTNKNLSQSGNEKVNDKENKWFNLPPFSPAVDGAALGKRISGRESESKFKNFATNSTSSMTAIKWVMRCCPELPRSLVQKLFRLRKVRRESSDVQIQEHQPKRVAAKDMMNSGDRLFLPVTVEKSPPKKAKCVSSDEEKQFLSSLILHKDPAIIVVNKPPGMPVQGGIGIKRSLDELAAEHLTSNDSESPRLVHRLDRDCSGILVMGRTESSASALHSIFREKTFEASKSDRSRIIQKTYQALVIGSPRRSEGLISVPLGKVVMDNGKSERVMVIDDIQSSVAQYALTEYRVIGSSSHGYTWLELSPLTGRKHQLRVHCAEVLGTPIVGDYKYGWLAHRKFRHFSCSTISRDLDEELTKNSLDPFGLNLWHGSISEKQPRLHLHCKEMILPDISLAMKHAESPIYFDIADLDSIKLSAPLPAHMQKSCDLLNMKI